jgi:hypothetical protein
VLDAVGNVAREGLDRELARDVLEDAALRDAGSGVLPYELEPDGGLDGLVQAHAEKIDVNGMAIDRMARELLEHDRGGRVAVDAEIDDGARAGEHVPERAVVDREGNGILAPAVDDAGHEPGPAQAARRPGALGLTSGNGEGGGL